MTTTTLTGWDAILSGRKTGIFYLHDAEPLSVKLARVLAEVATDEQLEGLAALGDPAVIGAIVSRFITSHENSRGAGIILRRITKTENDTVRAACKKTDRTRLPSGEWVGGDPDPQDYAAMRLAFAIVEPAIPGNDLRAKATWIEGNLSPLQIRELTEACMDLDGFNLQRIEEKVKN